NVGVEAQPTFQVRGATDPEGDAFSYEFRLSSDEEGTDVVATGSVAATDWTPEDELIDGVWWTARAVDSEGAASGWADARYVLPTSVTLVGCGSSMGGGEGLSAWTWLLLFALVPLVRRRS
ncbi:MAG: hypothetical protein KDA24_26200, partial [Deltaproteobacteria bacterium]|nr:hypothetical protein [Deltaproteobacteria bacterium]